MQVLSILQDASLEGAAQAKKNYGNTLTAEEEEVARANTDAVFEFACRYIVMKSLPGWIEEIWTEHLQSVHPVYAHTKEPGPYRKARPMPFA
jgi:hypothetical protein